MTVVSNLAPTSPKAANTAAAAGVAPSAAAFLALLAPVANPAEDTPAARQDDAAPGKDLPDDKDAPDPLAWITLGLVTPPIVAPAVTTPPATSDQPVAAATSPKIPVPTTTMTLPISGNEPAPPSVATPAAIAQPSLVALPGGVHPTAEPIIITPPVTEPAVASAAVKQPVAATTPPPPQKPQAAAAAAASSPAIALTPARVPAELELARIAPAAQVFAAAIQRATSEDTLSSTTGQPALAVVQPGTDNMLHAVTAMADPRQATLDMKQDNWPHQMIERIEALRDAANANDASIRLIPDALGKIDVSLKRDSDGVSVRLDAHQPETRQILADAQPRLVELAEARGLKLSAATGGTTDTGGQALSQQQQQRASQNAATNSAPPGATAEADDAADTDERIA